MRKPHIQRKFDPGTTAPFELLLILCTAIGIHLISGQYDWFEKLITFAHQYEEWEIDEILVITFYLALALGIFALRRWLHQRRIERVLQQQLAQLTQAMSEIQQLRGIIPICASCKNIRDDQGYWHQVESYIRDHSQADFTHGICPSCAKKLYSNHRQQPP